MDILYEDDSILVVNKPAGIATQAKGVGSRDLESECKKYRKQHGEIPEIYVVHRLDQPVSGIILFAKTKEAASVLSKDMNDDAFSKDYKARVYKGKEINNSGELRDFLLKDAKTNSSRVVMNNVNGAREAILSYEVEEDNEKTALLKVHLKTGRHHQIRVQLANAGMPILGDLKYGTDESIEFSKKNNENTVNLCAYHLTFKHPETGKKMEFTI